MHRDRIPYQLIKHFDVGIVYQNVALIPFIFVLGLSDNAADKLSDQLGTLLITARIQYQGQIL